MLRNKLYLLVVIVLIAACQQQNDNQTNETQPLAAADTIFVGDNILTMDQATQGATGVAIQGDQIIYVGDKDQALGMANEDTRVIELGDRALIPGFVDSHGHISMTARFIDYANLSSPPVGSINNIDDLVGALSQHMQDNPLAPKQWLVGYGYDDSLLAENRHPTRSDLDKVSKGGRRSRCRRQPNKRIDLSRP